MSIPLLVSRLAGRPMALAPRALDGLLALAPDAHGPMLQLRDDERDAAGYADRGRHCRRAGARAVVDPRRLADGAARRNRLWRARRTMEAAFNDPSAWAVLLELDPPGGDVGALFDLVERIGALRGSSGNLLWAVAGEAALSAAYAIASAADRLYVTRTAEIGSIGIVAAHVNESGADAMSGQSSTLVHAGDRKTDGTPHEPLSNRALATTQADVDALHAELCALVPETGA